MPPFATLLWLAASHAQAAEDAVASVLLVTGDGATAAVDGSTLPVAIGLDLDRDDTLHTPMGAAIVLILSNNYVVRVDEDLDLAVSELVLLGAAPTTAGARDQMASLLYPEDRANPTQVDNAERVAGWHSRLSAAYTPGADEAPAPASRGGGAPPTTTTTSTHTSTPPGAIAAPPDGFAAKEPKPSKHRPGDTEAAPAPAAVPRAVSTAVASPAFKAALAEWVATLPVPITGVDLVLHVADGKVTRVGAKGGLVPSEKLRQMLIGLDAGDVGRLDVHVDVK